MKAIDLTGQRFGRLTVLHRDLEAAGKRVKWVCRCDCGTMHAAHGLLLRGGRTQSCGCLRRELGRAHGARINRRHGEGGSGKESPEYRTWTNMLSRCQNPKHKMFPHYGARGITVCDRWLTYENFLADMGRRPSDAHSLDRIDNALGYAPENCRWATSVEQNRNTRGNRRIVIDGVERTLIEWLGHFQLSPHAFYNRLRRGLTEQEALLREKRSGRKLGTCSGEDH